MFPCAVLLFSLFHRDAINDHIFQRTLEIKMLNELRKIPYLKEKFMPFIDRRLSTQFGIYRTF